MAAADNSTSLQELWHSFKADLENHLATVDHLAQATFPILIHKQQKGDLIVLPPNVYHQVVNKVKPIPLLPMIWCVMNTTLQSNIC